MKKVFLFFFFSLNLFSKDILLLTLDTTRKDHITKEISPFLYEFSQNAIVFENCRTPVPLTLPAHTTILTGLYPKNHKVRNNISYKLDEKIPIISSFLKEKGYFTAAFVSSFVLNKSYGLNRGFLIYEDNMLQSHDKSDFEMEEVPANITKERVLNFLKEKKDEKKIFLWVHFFDPHFPYISHIEAPKKLSPYAQEIYYMDLQIKEIIREFQERRKGLIIITADHGEMLGEHKEKTHGIFLYESAVRVPLILKETGLNKKILSYANVSLIDIFPTILDYLNLKTKDKLEGISLFKLLEKNGARNFFFETFLPSESFGWATPFAVFDGRYKFIYLPKKELYYLKEDLKEEKNLFEGEKERSKILYNFLKREYTISFEENKSKKISLEETKKLEAIGYLVGSKPNQGKDPKDLIWIIEEFEKAREISREGKTKEAEEIFKKILKENPENYPAHIQYGTILREINKRDEAIKIFKRAKELNPQFLHAHFNLGTLYFEEKKYKEAEEEFIILLDLIPSFGEPYYYLIRIYLIEGEFNLAESILKKAKENLNPEENLFFYEGLYYAERGELERAIESFRSSLRYKENYFDAKFNLAQAYYKTGNIEYSLKEYEECLRINPDFPNLYLIIGSIYLKDFENFERARYYFNNFLLKFPNHPERKNVKEILKSF